MAILVFAAAGCSEESEIPCGDHIIDISYFFANESEEDLLLEVSGPATIGSSSLEVEAIAGETVLVLNSKEHFTLPDIGTEFWCVTVRRAADRVPVRQLCPVTNDHWSLRHPGSYEAEYTLVAESEGLVPVEDTCPMLSGVVVDATVAQPAAGVSVSLGREFNYGVKSGADGSFWMRLPAGVPETEVVFYKEGYVRRSIAVPDSLEHLGGGRYSIEAKIVRYPVLAP